MFLSIVKHLTKINKTIIFSVLLSTSTIVLTNIALAVQVVAIVGDAVITDYEVEQKSRAIALLNGIDISDPDVMKNIESEIIPMLIDNEIKKTYIAKLDVKLPFGVMENWLYEYTKKTGKKNVEELKAYVAKHKIEWNMFYETVEEEILWAQVAYGGFGNATKIENGELVQRAKARQLDHNDSEILERIKQEILMEKINLNVRKLISNAKKIHVVEKLDTQMN